MRISLFLSLTLLLFLGACKKDKIAPPNQIHAFVKYYGHVRSQVASDVKRTADGGYLILGYANSFASTAFSDYLLVKTDSMGNEEWSKTFGDGEGGYEEQGVRIVVLANDEGYLIAGNRTRVISVSGQNRLDQTLIHLYKLDLDGNIVMQKVLRENTHNKSDFVGDIKQLSDGGFVLTGSTSKVDVIKPAYNDYIAYDLLDVFTMRLDLDFNTIWETANGFVGQDAGVAVEVIQGAFVVTARAEYRTPNSTPAAPDFSKDVMVVRYKTTSGSILGQDNFGGIDKQIEPAFSCYDSINNVFTILAHVLDDNDGINEPNEGDLMVLQVTPTPIEVNRKYLGKSNGAIVGVTGKLLGGAIAVVPPQQPGAEPTFVATATHLVPGGNGTESLLIKLDENLASVWQGTRFFGRPGVNGQWLSGNKTSTVLVIEETISGTTRKELKGYAFTGSFDLGTNIMMGLIKTYPDGTLVPPK